MKKLRVAIIFGGQSAEHEVSLQSARNIYAALNQKKYIPVLICIDRHGSWRLGESSRLLLGSKAVRNRSRQSLAIWPGNVRLGPPERTAGQIDVAFPVLHGPSGEDGTVQGLLKLVGIPFVGADVLGSAIGMDKDVQKRLLRQAGIPVAKFLVIHKHLKHQWSWSKVKKLCGVPCFVKPANLGSSVGISKVRGQAEFRRAINLAFRYDRKIIIEEFIDGREIECAVLGNERPRASVLGEIVPHREFYDYPAKYLDESGAALIVPAKLLKPATQRIRQLAIEVFKVLECHGMARVDFFITRRHRVIVNEINTIPGFTNISMYPRLWAASGLSNSKLIDCLISLALSRHRAQKSLAFPHRRGKI